MKGILFLFWFLVLLLTVVLGLENPTPTTDWNNSSPNDAHQKESLANGWFKYPSGHWGRKFYYGCNTIPPPPVELSLVRPNTSFYLLTYLIGGAYCSNQDNDTSTDTLAKEGKSREVLRQAPLSLITRVVQRLKCRPKYHHP
ncbi:hypothetical protein DSO57_1028374 [Entomophthora muscae]|uniref:Uncharacterized protein n=1 Tax=Entomophthora muscae TaxID=34485 RepID=A0ACC2TNR5_9FUNG|nr:hypothetical protein DSO57_1028374 [Entomophthora muscae]